jgi:hypothetical protein
MSTAKFVIFLTIMEARAPLEASYQVIASVIV